MDQAASPLPGTFCLEEKSGKSLAARIQSPGDTRDIACKCGSVVKEGFLEEIRLMMDSQPMQKMFTK